MFPTGTEGVQPQEGPMHIFLPLDFFLLLLTVYLFINTALKTGESFSFNITCQYMVNSLYPESLPKWRNIIMLYLFSVVHIKFFMVPKLKRSTAVCFLNSYNSQGFSIEGQNFLNLIVPAQSDELLVCTLFFP